VQNIVAPGYSVGKKTWSSVEEVAPGILRYSDVIKKEINVEQRIENTLEESSRFKWQPAYVGYQQSMPEYRDCVDFKYKRTDIERLGGGEDAEKLISLWQDVYDVKEPAVQDYCRKFNIHNLRYWEAFNFIKYGPGQHFQEHHDHGYSYNCTVSLVAYPNDDYEGGELYFRLQNLMVKPKAGDLFIFPSNFMYPHRAMPVHSGTKYSIVTMLDYSAKFHTKEMYQETGD
jgi:hypothetical protein